MEVFEGEGAGPASSVADRYQMIRELGSHEAPMFAARMRGPGADVRLVVVERFARVTLGDAPLEPCIAAARVVATLQHTNLVRVRDFDVGREVVTIATDFVDGELLSELFEDHTAIPLPIALRLLTDVLTAASVLHAMRAPGGGAMPTAHGEIAGSNVLVGIDGIARLLRGCRVRTPRPRLPRDFASLAPEVLEGAPADPRSDVYSAGVFLWEMLSGAPPFDGGDAAAILECVRSGEIPRARVPDGEPWAAPLVELAARAMAYSPERRGLTAGMMAGEIRKIAGPRLATVARVAAFVKGAAGGKIAVRRALLESSEPRSARGRDEPVPSSGSMVLDDVEPFSERPAPAPRPRVAPSAPPPLPFSRAPSAPVPRGAPAVPSRTPTIRPSLDAPFIPPPPSSSTMSLGDVDPESVRPAPPLRAPANVTPLAAPLHLGTPRPSPAIAKPPPAPPAMPARVQTLAMPVVVAPAAPPAAPPEHVPPPPPSIDPIAEVAPPSGDEAPPAAAVAARSSKPPPTPFAFSLVDAATPPAPKRASSPPPAASKPPDIAALPPPRAQMQTAPSLVMQEKARASRRRNLALTSVLVAGVAAVAVWKLAPRAEETGAAPTKPSATAPAKTAPPPAVTPTVPTVSTSSAAVASAEPAAPTKSAAVAAPAPPPPVTVGATGTASPLPAPPPATTAAPPPAMAAPPRTVVTPPPPTATAPPPPPTTPKPQPTFDPTRI